MDNGAFTVWRNGQPRTGRRITRGWKSGPTIPVPTALIPDVIDGNEEANDALVEAWPFRGRLGVPVWHMDESIERLGRLAQEWPCVAIGSSGEWRTPGTHHWWQRMGKAMDEVCVGGRPVCKLHGLRMLHPGIVPFIPMASSDSAYVSIKTGRANWGGCYRDASPEVKASVLTARVEAYQSAPVWSGMPQQDTLFEDFERVRPSTKASASIALTG